MKSPEPEDKAQRKVKKENPRELVRIIWKLSYENYQWELSSENYDLVYHHAEKLRFIGILAYPKKMFWYEEKKYNDKCTNKYINILVTF